MYWFRSGSFLDGYIQVGVELTGTREPSIKSPVGLVINQEMDLI